VTVLITNLIRWKREKWVPERDIIALFTSDEETDATNGIQWVIAHQRKLIEAEYALNTDGGGVELANDKPRSVGVEASEKVYVTFQFAAVNSGGHSSRPRRDNAIYALAHALERLEAYKFPAKLNEITRAYLERSAALQSPDTAADMRAIVKGFTDATPDSSATASLARLSGNASFNAFFRTTCVATKLEGGHADNALPQRAVATVNCRMLPNDSPTEVEAALKRLAGDSIKVSISDPYTQSDPSPLRPELMTMFDEFSAKYWPGAPVIPTMSLGATDGLFLRNAGIPTYAFSALAEVDGEANAHGLNEKVREKSIYDAVAFWNDMLKKLASTRRTL
ncbi:MAG: M20/M25/M40 family metallo-hydrolase, partial [Gemmatimonadaceae bacterium]